MASKTNDVLAQVMAAPTPAAAARALGVNGKGLRDVLRRAGVYVSHDATAWNDDSKRYVHAHFTTTGDARKAARAAFDEARTASK